MHLKHIKDAYELIGQVRRQFVGKFYKRRIYSGRSQIVDVVGDFGLEESKDAVKFMNTSSLFIDFDAENLYFNLSGCTRIWPSGAMLLASLKQWAELTCVRNQPPKIGSSRPSDDRVGSYMHHCGLNRYLNRISEDQKSYFRADEVVPIRHEKSRSSVEQREDEIIELLSRRSLFSKEQRELFMDKVLLEVGNNVTEHGITYLDNGWWVIAQYHPRHGIISICYADNGIGIRHSLMTGPQSSDIDIQNDSMKDGKFIELALTKPVSGALKATRLEKKLWGPRRRSSGTAGRGNGLKRMLETTKALEIPFKILSHHGYAFVDRNGEIEVGAFDSRIFAGTMYHFIIPAIKEEREINEGH